MFGRLKDFRGIAIPYDQSADNLLAVVYVTANIYYLL